MPTPADSLSPGRPRNPSIEPRVTAAAIQVYAQHGWAGFTFEAVAREAGVGKPAIYLRWSSREELLVQAFEQLHFPFAQDLGSVRADLLDYSQQWVEWYRDLSRGRAVVRLGADCLANPVLLELIQRVIVKPRAEAARAITRRAIKRGQSASSVRSGTMIELLMGAMQSHYVLTHSDSLDQLAKTFAAYGEHLVEIIIAGAEALDEAEVGATNDFARRSRIVTKHRSVGADATRSVRT